MAETETVEEARARRSYEAEEKAKALVDQMGRFVNGMSTVEADAFAIALSNEHPTLLGQIAKATGRGIVMRALYDPEWRAWQSLMPDGKRPCTQRLDLPEHADHDGRLDCTTVIGGELLARQSYI